MMIRNSSGSKKENLEVFIIHRRLLYVSRCPDPPPRRKIAVQKLAMMPLMHIPGLRRHSLSRRHLARCHSYLYHLYNQPEGGWTVAQSYSELSRNDRRQSIPECYRPEARPSETDLSHWSLTAPRGNTFSHLRLSPVGSLHDDHEFIDENPTNGPAHVG